MKFGTLGKTLLAIGSAFGIGEAAEAVKDANVEAQKPKTVQTEEGKKYFNRLNNETKKEINIEGDTFTITQGRIPGFRVNPKILSRSIKGRKQVGIDTLDVVQPEKMTLVKGKDGNYKAIGEDGKLGGVFDFDDGVKKYVVTMHKAQGTEGEPVNVDSLFKMYKGAADKKMEKADKSFAKDYKEVLGAIDSLNARAGELDSLMGVVNKQSYPKSYWKAIREDKEGAKVVQEVYKALGYDVDTTGDVKDQKTRAAVRDVNIKVNDKLKKKPRGNQTVYGTQSRNNLGELVKEESAKFRKQADEKKSGEYNTAYAAKEVGRAELLQGFAATEIKAGHADVAKRLLQEAHDNVMGDVLNHDGKNEKYVGFRESLKGYMNNIETFKKAVEEGKVKPIGVGGGFSVPGLGDGEAVSDFRVGADLRNPIDHASAGYNRGGRGEHVTPLTMPKTGNADYSINEFWAEVQKGAISGKINYTTVNGGFDVNGKKINETGEESLEMSVGGQFGGKLGEADLHAKVSGGVGLHDREIEEMSNENVKLDDSYNETVFNAEAEFNYGPFKLQLEWDRKDDFASDDYIDTKMAEPELRFKNTRLKLKIGNQTVDNSDKWNQKYDRFLVGGGFQHVIQSDAFKGLLKGLEFGLEGVAGVSGDAITTGKTDNYAYTAHLMKKVADNIAVGLYMNGYGTALNDGKRDARTTDSRTFGVGIDYMFGGKPEAVKPVDAAKPAQPK